MVGSSSILAFFLLLLTGYVRSEDDISAQSRGLRGGDDVPDMQGDRSLNQQAFPFDGGIPRYTDKPFYIVHVASGLVLDVRWGYCSSGTKIQLWPRNGTPAQHFRVQGYDSIINVKCTKALDITNGNCGDGTNLQLWDINRTPAQIFTFAKWSRDRTSYYMWNQNCQKYISVDQFWYGADVKLRQFDQNARPNQIWRFEYI